MMQKRLHSLCALEKQRALALCIMLYENDPHI